MQSTAYTGPLDEKWEITIGGGLIRKFLFNHFINKKTINNHNTANDYHDYVNNNQNNR